MGTLEDKHITMEEAEESISLLPNASVLLLLSLGALLTLLLLSYLLWPSTCPLDGCSGMLLMRPSPWASAPAPADSLRDRILLSLGKEEGHTPPLAWRGSCQLEVYLQWQVDSEEPKTMQPRPQTVQTRKLAIRLRNRRTQ